MWNVESMKNPPGYTFVCQPADTSWNKPLKDYLRSNWGDQMLTQLKQTSDQAKLIERPLIAACTDNVMPGPQWEEIFRLARKCNVEHDALARHPVIDPAKGIEVISASFAAANTPIDPESDIPSSEED
ncbi:unnamed protein product [Phytophthora fragariaefolia]|uniref:Unnamed protein product n=1 Tax=Phytophthora fragariaefolia TaxID=1490495 RepID=A0A9W7D2E4_9STRA|nr:unnamed protein product [Phytophthora fragariaefolia]